METAGSVRTGLRKKGVLTWLRNIGLALLCLVAFIVITGVSYQLFETYKDSRRFRHTGRLVDIGGYRLNLNCTGQGSPTVVFDSGFGGPAMEWTLVQPPVAQFTRVCSYDRAGYGWSDA